jgi:hypothetical protein
MPKNKVSDLITDQEMAFARLVLAGNMTDRGAAEAAGLNPDTAAYTKSKPRVRAYMIEHRAAMQQQFLDQETERLRRQNLRREQVLDRLWVIANMSPEMTRDSITGQVKALSMIVHMEGLIPDRRAGSSAPQRTSSQRASSPQRASETYSAPLPTHPEVPADGWLHEQQAQTTDPQPGAAVAQEEDQPGFAEPEPASGSTADKPPLPCTTLDPNEYAIANRLSASENKPSAPYAPLPASVPDTRAPFSINKKPSAWRR